jgi:hypothetical protein
VVVFRNDNGSRTHATEKAATAGKEKMHRG